MAEMKLERILGKIHHASFATQYEAASTMIRFSEYYENPKLRGTAFTLDEVMDFWAQKNGKMEYFEYWEGFNVPSIVFETFTNGKMDPLREKEKALLEALKKIPSPFYLIATREGIDPATMKHEIAHGLFYTNAEYYKKAVRIISEIDKKPIFEFLRDENYHESVWHDETHAYLLDGGSDLRKAGIALKPYREAQKQLQALYREFTA